VYEVEHPLNSADDLHDFSLSPGSTVGFQASIQVWSVTPSCNFGPSCVATTAVPSSGTGDIVVSDGSGMPLESTPDELSLELVEGGNTTASFSIRNTWDQSLDLAMTEAPSDCAAPGDVGWLIAPHDLTLAAGASTDVDVSVDASGLTAPDVHTARVCVELEGNTVLELPVNLQVLYPFSGFLATFRNPPVLNEAHSDGVQTFWFRLGGDRGLNVVSASESRRIDCATAEPVGPLEPAATPSWTGLSYQAYTGRYAYPWKTTTAYKGTCREFVLTLADRSVHTARLHFFK
jgi:hypothetical protein